MKYALLFIITVLTTGMIIAQTVGDAVRYSFLPQFNSARSIGVGGSMSPLGADISVATINPAGIAEFRKSELVIGFGVPNNTADTQLSGAVESNNSAKFQLNNLGIVFAYRPNAPKLKTMNLSIGINKLADYSQNMFYSGSTQGTRVERYLELSNLRTLDELDNFEAGLAYDVDLISDADGDNLYESDFITFTEVLRKQELIVRSGSLQELFINFAANYDHKISFGLTLGIPIINFTERKDYTEVDDLLMVSNFNDFTYIQNLNTTGGGINLKGGVIYKLTPKLRVSAAIHSPTWMFLTDNFSTSLEFFIDNSNEGLISESPLSEFEYRLRTPWRAIAGLGIIYNLGAIKGFVSGEVEYVDYSASSFDLTTNSNDPFDQFLEEDLNNEIKSLLSQALNYRLGSELALSKIRLRIGAAMLHSPYDNNALTDIDLQLTGGLGWRENKFYVDLSFNTRRQSENYTPYRLLDANNNQTVSINQTIKQFALTVGYKI